MPYDDVQALAERLEQFIRAQFAISSGDKRFTRQVHLWEAGYVDSVGMTELIAFLEDSFEVSVPQEAFFSPDFTHIDGIARIVYRLRADRATTSGISRDV
jgi:acyl carrier protein